MPVASDDWEVDGLLFADAAEAVLREAGRRLSFREIVEVAIDRGYITSSAANPSASMAWAVKSDIRKRGAKR